MKAEADIPDLKMHATMTLRKNTDATLQATHTIDLKFSFADGAPITGFKDVGLPQMRIQDSTAADALTSVKVKISDTYFLIALAKGEADTTRTLDLMQTRSWFDFPLLLNDDRIAKVVFQKSPEGRAMLDKAFDAWKSETPAPPVEARVGQALSTVEDLPQYKFAREVEHSVTGGSAESRYLTTVYGMIKSHLHESPDLRLDLANRHGIVDFYLDEGGKLTGRKLVASSGSPNLDSAVMTAIAAAAPYPAPPHRSPTSLNYNFGKRPQLNTDTSASAARAPIVLSVPPPAVGQPATAPASPDTATAPATPTHRFNQVGVADNTLIIGHFASVNPDCTSSGKTFVRVSRPPSHGSVTMKEGIGFSHFENKPQCDSTKLPGVTVDYLPERGFTGSDEFVLDVINQTGYEGLASYSITIK